MIRHISDERYEITDWPVPGTHVYRVEVTHTDNYEELEWMVTEKDGEEFGCGTVAYTDQNAPKEIASFLWERLMTP